MSNIGRHPMVGWLALCVWPSFGSVALAQETSTTSLSAQDLRAIEGSFGAHPEPEPLVGAASVINTAIQDLNPAMALIFDGALGWFQGDPLQVGAHDPNRTGFTFQQLELSLSANVDPFFRLDANIVFAQFGVEVEEAYATTLGLPLGLQLRAGQFLTRFGRINPTHPHTWSFMDQPLVIGKMFGGEGNRGLGLELSWLAPLPWYVELVGSANDAAGACCARSFFGSDDLGIAGVGDLLYTAALKQFFPFDEDWSMSLGLDGQVGPNASGNGNRSAIYGVDLYLRYRPIDSPTRSAVSLQAEGLFRTRQRPDTVLQDAGFYAQLVWAFDLQWETGARYEYVGGVEGDDLDPEWDRARHRAALQLTYYPSHFARIRAQANYDRPLFIDEPILAALINLEVVIGAHGAHTF